MGLLTKPSALTTLSRILYSWLNSRVDDLYDIIGTTTNGRGSLNYLNLSASANLDGSQIANTAAVLGGGSEQAMANPFNMSMPRLDTSSGAFGTLTNAAAAAKTVDKLFQKTSGTTNITTITGGKENELMVIVKIHSCSLTHSATDVLDSLHNKTIANYNNANTAADAESHTYIYTTNNGSWANLQW